MNCPTCSTQVTRPGRFCVKCGNDFGEEFSDRIAHYFGLKDEFKRVAELQNNLASGLKDLLRGIESYEEMLTRDLERSRAETSGQAQPSPQPIMAELVIAAQPESTSREPAAVGQMEKIPARKPKRDYFAFEIHVGQKWLLIVGILTMVFGVGYFLKYSFEQGWVGPEGRVAMAYLWGIVFLVVGDRFRKSFERFGLSLIGGGIAVLYFSAFAAFQIYHLFGQTASFSIMVMITVLACVLAIRYDTKWLAVLGLIGGFLTPVLLTTGQDNQIALMTYMTILNFGLLGIAFYKKWDLLNILGFIFTYLLYTAWYQNHYAATKFWPAIFFLNVYFLTYSFVPFIYQVREGGHSDGREFVLMGINSLLAFGYGYVMIRDLYGLAWVSIISVFYAAVFLSLATYLYQKGKHTLDVFVVMLAKAMLFLIITVPVLFSKQWITIFWSAQSLAVVWMAVRLCRRSLIAGGYVLLLVTALKFLLYDYGFVFHLDIVSGFLIRGGYTYLIIERYLTTVLLVIAISVAGFLMMKAASGVQWSERGDAPYLSLLLGIVSFIALTVETSAFFYDYLLQARFAAISVLWTLFSVVLMLLGFRKNNPMLRKVSFGLFLVVVIKVFLFDMSNFSTPYRIISFIILGLVLVGTSYLYYRHKDRIIDALAENEKAGERG
jgi:uncharacterized membrane protein